MPNINTQGANIPLVKRSYKKLLALGEGINSTDFTMVFDGYENLGYLVQTGQLPEMKREVIDSKGSHGVMFKQQGNFINAGDVTIAFKEVISGELLTTLRKIVKEKIYLDIFLTLNSETKPEGIPGSNLLLEDCWIELDATDLDNDSGTTLIKPSGTIHYNWPTWLDDAGEVEAVAWE